MPTNNKKPQLPAIQHEQPPAKKNVYKPRRIKPTDHAKYYIVKESGKADIILPLDANENRRQRQLDAAAYRGFLKDYIGTKHKKNELSGMKPNEVKQLGEALKIADELDRMAWQDDIPMKPRSGGINDLDELMESAVNAGMKIKEKMQKSQKKVIDAKTTDIVEEE
jgi:hypothetical protein